MKKEDSPECWEYLSVCEDWLSYGWTDIVTQKETLNALMEAVTKIQANTEGNWRRLELQMVLGGLKTLAKLSGIETEQNDDEVEAMEMNKTEELLKLQEGIKQDGQIIVDIADHVTNIYFPYFDNWHREPKETRKQIFKDFVLGIFFKVKQLYGLQVKKEGENNA